MKDPAINDASLEEIIPKAAKGDGRALDLLMSHLWLYQLLNRIADWAWRRYKVVHDEEGKDVQDVVSGTIRAKITTLKNSRNIPWRVCLRAFSYEVAKRHCLNYLDRGRRREERYRDSVTHDHTIRIEKGWNRIVEPCSATVSEEEERAREEQESLRESQILKIDQTIWRVFNSLAPEEARIVRLWALGLTLDEIAGVTGIPRATVQRRLKKSQKAFVKELGKMIEELGKTRDKEVGAEQILEGLTARRAGGLRELIASSLREMDRRRAAPYAGV